MEEEKEQREEDEERKTVEEQFIELILRQAEKENYEEVNFLLDFFLKYVIQ